MILRCHVVKILWSILLDPWRMFEPLLLVLFQLLFLGCRHGEEDAVVKFGVSEVCGWLSIAAKTARNTRIYHWDH